MFPSPQIVEMVGRLGFDWVLLDCEHGSLSPESVELMAMAAEAVGITPIARPALNSPEAILRVVDKLVGELAEQLAAKKVTLELTPEGRSWLAEHGFDRLMGARPMGRLIQNEVKKPLAEKILFGELLDGGPVIIGAEDGKLSLTVAAEAPVPLPS